MTIPINDGMDIPGPITLEAGSNTVSLPYQHALVDAEALCSTLGLPDGTTVRQIPNDAGFVSGYICGGPGPFQLHAGCEGGITISDLVSPITYTNPITPGTPAYPPCIGQSGNRYCIAGSANNIAYAWGIDLSKNGLNTGNEPYVSSAPGIIAGSNATALASAFSDSINALAFSGVAAIQSGSCFDVTVTPFQQFDLYVGPSGSIPPNLCKVTAAGCVYNPTIMLDAAPTVAIPTLGEWATVALLIAIIFSGVAILRRNRARGVDPAA